MKLLVIAPHCDDAEYGVGGTIARHLREKTIEEVMIAVVACTVYDPTRTGYEEHDWQRWAQQTQACEAMRKVNPSIPVNCVILGAPGKYLENRVEEKRSQLIKDLDSLIQALKFDDVFIPLPSYNQDHVAIHDACITALRPAGHERFMPTYVWAYEYPMNCWGPTPPYNGKSYVRMTAQDFEAKKKALLKHSGVGEGEGFGIKDMAGVKSLAKMRGNEVNCDFAEMFYLVREVY